MTQSNTVTASDGVPLAVHAYTGNDKQCPTILAVHGYPDNHHVWDGVAADLSWRYNAEYNFVAYDVRGAWRIINARKPFGVSAHPAGRRYRCGDRQPGSRPGPSVGPRLGLDPVLGGGHRRLGDGQDRLVHVDLRDAPELCGQVSALTAYTPRRGRRRQPIPGLLVHLVLPVPRCARGIDPRPGACEGL